jgi:hypothetical protein
MKVVRAQAAFEREWDCEHSGLPMFGILMWERAALHERSHG